jgi:ATP-dependent Clp protease ATP-binding subunit ClpC
MIWPMRQNLSETLRGMLAEAQKEARLLNQDFVSTEHLLLGVVRCDTCEAARALRAAEVDVGELRAALMHVLPRGKEDPVVTGDLPLSPKAQRVINNAIVKAQSLREKQVTTRLVVLALLDEQDTALRRAFREAGADMDLLTRKLAERPVPAEE